MVAALAAIATVLLFAVRDAFSVDSWLALVAGRDVWQSGIPQHNSLTVIAHGGAWIDQQWLAQLVTYGLYRVGGLSLVGLANVGLMMSGLAGAVVGARRLGTHPRTLVLLLSICTFLLLPSGEVRTQAFAYPLFVATLYLMASDSRQPSARVYWCLPLLALWSNLHGSASLGAGLVALRGLTLAWERRDGLRHGLGAWRRPLALTVGAPLCLFMTPYGTSIVSYYHATLLNGALKQVVTEWQPVTSSTIVAVLFFLLLGSALWSFGRYGSQTTLWERAGLVMLGIAGIDAFRNVAFFSLAAVVIVGLSIDAAVTARWDRAVRVRLRLNRMIAVGTVLAVTGAALAIAVKPTSAFENAGLRRAVGVVSTRVAADHSLRVMADQSAADWLLWRVPSLRGRVAFDVRFELLSASTLHELQRFEIAAGPDWKQTAQGYRLLVLDARTNPVITKAFMAEPGRRILYDDGTYLVILRSQAVAG